MSREITVDLQDRLLPPFVETSAFQEWSVCGRNKYFSGSIQVFVQPEVSNGEGESVKPV